MTIEEARTNIGRGVVYKPAGHEDDLEVGVITSVGQHYVFVRYAGDDHGIATPPERLMFEVTS